MKTIFNFPLRLLRFFTFVLLFLKYTLSKLGAGVKTELRRNTLTAYPAVHIRKPGPFDYMLNFAAEITILGLIVLTWSVSAFYMSGQKDVSIAANLLTSYSHLNPDLYAKITSTKTITVQKSLITEAYASEEEPLEARIGAPISPDANANISVESGAFFAHPTDDVKQSILSKITDYEVKPGDTLQSIAKEHSINEQTIMWSNMVSLDKLRVGQIIKILPTDGILVQAGPNTTLRDLAARYKVKLDDIIAYNGLVDENDFDDGDLLLLRNGAMPSPEAVKKNKSESRTNTKAVSIPSNLVVLDDDLYDGTGTTHAFVPGQCTWYAAKHFPVTWGGHAKYWISNARAAGYQTGSQAVIGSVVQTRENKRYGHVGIVTDISDGRIQITDMNFGRPYKISTRWLSEDSSLIVGYIYRPR